MVLFEDVFVGIMAILKTFGVWGQNIRYILFQRMVFFEDVFVDIMAILETSGVCEDLKCTIYTISAYGIF